ncbi:MAG: LLM class flavin-dependent oxidoreductase [Chloroflexota bacterium]|nr:LLM class flavin-dependent oxidoreductase [Chloroflexota bacterium]
MSRPLKVGVQLPEVERVVRWPELREMAQTAEGIGLDSIWVGEHLLYRYTDRPPNGPWEAWSTMAALAAVTERAQIGPLVACTAFHNPAVLAKQAAALDEISGGRLILALGAGWNETEFGAFGIPFDQRVSRFEEAFTIIRELLRSGQTDVRGRFHQAPECELLPPPTRPGGPPLMVGSLGERMLGLTLPHVDAWNAWYEWFGNSPAGYRAVRDQVDTACRAVGRDPDEVERTVALLVAFPGATGRLMGDTGQERVQPIPSAADELAAALGAFAAEGIAHVQLVLDPITVESIAGLAPALELLDR